MQPRDWMWLEIKKIENAQVFLMLAYDYRFDGRPPKAVNTLKKFGMLRGKDFYLLTVGDSTFPGSVKFKTWVEKAPSRNTDPFHSSSLLDNNKTA